MRRPVDAQLIDPTVGGAKFAARVRSALIWRWGSQMLGQLITWTATLIVVRLLDPTDYGLFAMSQAVLIALNFLNGDSFASSLIQAKDVTERRIGQVFGLLLCSNVMLAAIQIVLAPYAARHYGQPVIDPPGSVCANSCQYAFGFTPASNNGNPLLTPASNCWHCALTRPRCSKNIRWIY